MGIIREDVIPTLTDYAHLFDASAGASNGIRNRNGEVLVISGLLVDRVIAVGSFPRDVSDGPLALGRLIIRWKELYDGLVRENDIQNKSDARILAEWALTVCAETYNDLYADDHLRRCSLNEALEHLNSFEQCIRICQQISHSSESSSRTINENRIQDRMLHLCGLASMHTFFVTTRGRMGLAPTSRGAGAVRIGDEIWIVPGSPFPLRLRKTSAREGNGGNGLPRYTYHNCVYVHGE
jgi:hypothetical protein